MPRRRGLKAENEAMTRVEGLSALLLEVVDTQDPIEVGADTSYEIRITNTGTKTETDVRLACTIPDQMQLKLAQGPVRFQEQGKMVVFEPLPKLAPRADAIYRIFVKAAHLATCVSGRNCPARTCKNLSRSRKHPVCPGLRAWCLVFGVWCLVFGVGCVVATSPLHETQTPNTKHQKEPALHSAGVRCRAGFALRRAVVPREVSILLRDRLARSTERDQPGPPRNTEPLLAKDFAVDRDEVALAVALHAKVPSQNDAPASVGSLLPQRSITQDPETTVGMHVEKLSCQAAIIRRVGHARLIPTV